MDWRPVDSFRARGATAYVGPYPFDCARADAIGRPLTVDGVPQIVAGIEWHAIQREPRRGETVSIIFA